MMLGAAGLPIYIHAPKYFVDQYGVSLSTLGLALFALRSLDFVQDPILAALAQRSRERGQWPIYASILLLGLGMLGLFALAPPFLGIARPGREHPIRDFAPAVLHHVGDRS